MWKNFRKGVLAQLMLVAFVGCSMTLHATTLTCTNTIALDGSGFLASNQITSGTCVQVGDKLYGDFNFGNLPGTGFLSFASNSVLNRASVTFSFAFAPGVSYNFGYQVDVFNSSNLITAMLADVVQTVGTSSLSASLTPTGTGTINFTKTGNVPSGTNASTFTLAQGVTDLTVTLEDFTKGANSDASGVLNTIEESPPAHVPEPASVMLLSSGMLGLASLRCRRFLKK